MDRRVVDHPGLLTVGVLAAGYGALQWAGRTFGSTPAERRSAMAGDEIVEGATLVTTHAATIDAPPSVVWPWLVQTGWHRGGWYTAEWVDRLLFPANRASATRIIPELQHREVGDFVPDGPPDSGCGFIVARLDRERCMVLHSTTHLPRSWRERLGASLEWTWSFTLADPGDGTTRLAFRTRVRAAPRWVIATYQLVIVPADFVMARQMLRGIAARAEGQAVSAGR